MSFEPARPERVSACGDERALVARLASGDGPALAEAYRRHRAVVRAHARRLLADDAAAEDVLHDVLLGLPAAARRFRGATTLRSLLLAMAGNLSRRLLRGLGRCRRAMDGLALESRPEGIDPERDAERQELIDDLRTAWEQLGTDKRSVVLLCGVEQRPVAEVARALGIPPGTVRSRLCHARRRLRGGVAGAGRLRRSGGLAALAAAAAVVTALGAWASPMVHDWLAARVCVPPARTAHEVEPLPTPTPSAAAMLPPLSRPTTASSRSPTPVKPPPQPRERRPLAADTSDALYAAAHTLHFARRDFAEALEAWERYLALAPHGRFVPEARYNRAIALGRLGRFAEASAALEPFARGVFGTYRQADATRLLAALRGRAPDTN